MESNVDPPAPLAPVEFKRARPGHQRAQGKSVERARRNGRLLPVGGLARFFSPILCSRWMPRAGFFDVTLDQAGGRLDSCLLTEVCTADLPTPSIDHANELPCLVTF